MNVALNAVRPIPFNKADVTEAELAYIRQSLDKGHISGDGHFTEKCHELLSTLLGSPTLLTHSCTAALEAASILIDLAPGDEVIMPSFTFVSTANAVVLRGAVPVFVDIRRDTLNVDETLIEAAITPKTRAIYPIHYAGIGAEMDTILDIANRHGLKVVEDAAQGFACTYKGKPLGTIGDLGALSFHETKNIVSGEGGALIINRPDYERRALYIREKGTNRTEFLRREVMKYEWIDLGSSYLPSDVLAAILLAQLERYEGIIAARQSVWARYEAGLKALEAEGRITLPTVPAETVHNGHIFYFLTPTDETRVRMLAALKADGINATSHYVPLHSAPAGRRFARTHGDLTVTDQAAARIVRLPCFSTLTTDQIDHVVARVTHHVHEIC